MEPLEFSMEACSGRTGWDVEPSEELDLTLEALSSFFDEVKVDTEHVIIVEAAGADVSIYPDGSMFVKEVEDRDAAEEAVSEVADAIQSL